MIPARLLDNLVPWVAQVFFIAAVGAFLPVILVIRHPRTQLIYSHTLLALCLLVPFVQPWQHPVVVEEATVQPVSERNVTRNYPSQSPQAEPTAPKPSSASSSIAPSSTPPAGVQVRWKLILFSVLVAGALARLGWLLTGLWQIRKYRIAATPLYPLPESVEAAFALTHADAVICVSSQVPGPVMFGLFRPVILLPEMFLTLDDEAQCSVACHELLHVRRRDWLMTIVEELAGIVLWFNPAIWWLLAQTRLVREQFVDAEVVRLTASREPYLDALLTIARARPGLDLAPAPLFLRRRHLTQRMHALLKEISMSKLRLISSYFSITTVLAFTGWCALLAFPFTGYPQVRKAAVPAVHADLPIPPIPQDQHELATGNIHVPATPAERASALSLLERSRQNSDMHMPSTPPFILKVSFNAGGNVPFVGNGDVTETWFSGRNWRWTADLGGYSQARVSSNGQLYDEKPVTEVPMRVHTLRAAIFWPVNGMLSDASIRTATAQWNGSEVTCILAAPGKEEPGQGRRWNEREFCIDNATGLLQIHSEAPGAYVVYGYSKNLEFHGRRVPDAVSIFAAGSKVLEAQVAIIDAGSEENFPGPSQEMTARGPVMKLVAGPKFAINALSNSGAVQAGVVHAILSKEGSVLEEEVSSVSDPALTQAALDAVKNTHYSQAESTQREVYVTVRFFPPGQ